MVECSVKVTSSMEARPAALFVQTASKFSSSIKIKMDDKTVNAKSIMGVIAMDIINGQNITIIADGNDENIAVNELAGFLTKP